MRNTPKKQGTPRPEVYENDLIPNALIFLQPNWRTLAHNLRLRDMPAKREGIMDTYKIGSVDKYD